MAHLAAIKLIGTAFAAGSSLIGGLQGAQAADFNRRQALAEADARRAEAAREAHFASEEAARVFGRAEATAGASGFTLGGSAADVLGDLAGQRSFNVRNILHQGEIARAALIDEAAAHKRSGAMSLLKGVLGAGGAVLGGMDARRPPQKGPVPDVPKTGGPKVGTPKVVR